MVKFIITERREKMTEANYYAIIPANIRYDKDLPPNAKLLYGEITALSNEKGYCWATNSYFANLYNVNNITVSRWINQLVKKGYVTSVITYKNETKEIDSRKLYIGHTPIIKNDNTPIIKNDNTPIIKMIKRILQVLIIQVLIYIVQMMHKIFGVYILTRKAKLKP